MAKIEQFSSGKYSMRVYIGTDMHGKKIVKRITADSKTELKRMAAELEISRHTSEGSIAGKTRLLGDAMRAYIDARVNVRSPSTVSTYEKYRRNYAHDLQALELREITSEKINEAINRDAANLSPKTLHGIYGFISAVCRENGIAVMTRYPQQRKRIRRLPEPKDVYELVRGTEIELPVLLAMWQGLRMSEVLGLKYGDVEDGIMIIRNTIITCGTEHIERAATKTVGSTRRLAVPEYLLNLIGDGAPDAHVVPLTANAITKRFGRMQEKAGMPHICFHDLRHLNASIMLRLGISDKIAMERGGWSSPAVLKSVYQEIFDADRQAADARINATFAEIINQK